MLNLSLELAVSLLGGAVFAVSGAMAAAERRLDILGFMLLALVTGCGGGTLRDVLLGTRVFWVEAPINLYICMVVAVFAYCLSVPSGRVLQLLVWADAFGISAFSVLGAAKAMDLGAAPVVAVLMGIISATIGSVIRDIFLSRAVLLLQPEIYVTATLLGSGSYTLMVIGGVPDLVAIPLAIALALGLRSAAILWCWQLPRYDRGRDEG